MPDFRPESPNQFWLTSCIFYLVPRSGTPKANFSFSNRMNKYFLYARKSSEAEERQVMSIEAQFAELKEFAAKEKLEIVASFEEAKTAKEPGRTMFGEMLDRMVAGEASGILAWHPDRL